MGTGWAQLGEVLGGLSVLVRQGDPTLHSRACVEPLLLSITVPAPNFKTTERARPFLKTAHGWGPTRD